MEERRINILCLQETKWVGEKAKTIKRGSKGYKLWYSGWDKSRNGVGIIMDDRLAKDVVEVCRKNDRIMKVKIVYGKEIVNVISAYAPQVGAGEAIKKRFWEDLDEVVQCTPLSEKLYIGGDLNGHVGTSRVGFESVHGGFGYGIRNEGGETILDFAQSYDLILANTWFKKRESHLVTFRSGANATQIDFFLTRRVDRRSCLNCKVIPGECVTTQHKLLILDVCMQSIIRKKRSQGERKIRWWRLKEEYIKMFVDKVVSKAE